MARCTPSSLAAVAPQRTARSSAGRSWASPMASQSVSARPAARTGLFPSRSSPRRQAHSVQPQKRMQRAAVASLVAGDSHQHAEDPGGPAHFHLGSVMALIRAVYGDLSKAGLEVSLRVLWPPVPQLLGDELADLFRVVHGHAVPGHLVADRLLSL